jgi:predicted nuclease of restriction endonuclease-like (RecB) superfamily
LKIGEDFNIDNLKSKRIRNDEFFIYNLFEHIWFKMFLILKNMDFENVPLTKVVHIYVIEGMNA